jgi:hypothetical protein
MENESSDEGDNKEESVSISSIFLSCPDIDESEAKFSPEEYRVAELLYKEGKCVKALPVSKSGRNPDALVGTQIGFDGKIIDGIVFEFKSLDFGATSKTITSSVKRSLARGGQSRNIIVDGRNSGLMLAEAQRGLRRVAGFQAGKLDSLRIIGDGFDIATTFP